MKRTILAACLALLPALAWSQGERLPINNKPAPQGRQDLEAIQDALQESLGQARAATVSLDMGGGAGSGVIVSEDGLVLTAAHVSMGVDRDLTVILEDGTRLKARSLGLDGTTDAGMVKIEEEGPFPFVELDRLERLKLGDWVFSLGHSGGFDEDRGSVVRIGRLVRVANQTIQSDCTLIGGDSGGPLFDLNGRLVGIHSRVGGQLGVNMHVPIREFIRNWDALLGSEFIAEGPFAQAPRKGSGFLGVATEPANEGGLLVTRIGRDSPAAEAGLEEGDRILKLNDVELESREQLREILAEMAAGDRVALEISREDEIQTLNFRLGER